MDYVPYLEDKTPPWPLTSFPEQAEKFFITVLIKIPCVHLNLACQNFSVYKLLIWHWTYPWLPILNLIDQQNFNMNLFTVYLLVSYKNDFFFAFNLWANAH